MQGTESDGCYVISSHKTVIVHKYVPTAKKKYSESIREHNICMHDNIYIPVSMNYNIMFGQFVLLFLY